MKVDDRYYCIKDRYDGNSLVNKSGMIYEVRMYDFNFDKNTIWMSNESHMSIYFYRSMRDIYGNIKEQRFGYIFSDYFISLRELRKLKLKRLKMWTRYEEG